MIKIYLSVFPASTLISEVENETIPSSRFWGAIINKSFENCKHPDDATDFIILKAFSSSELTWLEDLLKSRRYTVLQLSKQPTEFDKQGIYLNKTRDFFRSVTGSIKNEVNQEKWSAIQKTDNSNE